MSKIRVALVGFILAAIIIPGVSSAQSASDLQAQIQALLAKIQQLQAQLAQIQGGTPARWCHTFNTNLGVGGASGDDVDALQTVLQREGISISRDEYLGNANFGESTASAVSAFQEKYRGEILTPAGLSSSTGYVGARTRAKLNKLYGCGTTLPSPSPTPKAPSPAPAPRGPQTTGETTGDQKTLVLLVNFLDSPTPSLTKDQIKNMIFNGPMQKFYKEVSYNQVSFSGDVYGWITLPRKAKTNEGDSDCTWPQLGDKAELEGPIAENNIDMNKYSRVVILANHDCFTGRGSSGVGKELRRINGQYYTFSSSVVGLLGYDTALGGPFGWTLFDEVIAHEMGHQLGVDHSDSWVCDWGGIIYGSCTIVERGNPFDIMGWGYYGLHFNSFYKQALGWLDNNSVVTAIKSGTYKLNPLETDKGVRAVKIPLKDGTSYYLEYRKGIGFDSKMNEEPYLSNQNGLFVNWIVANSSANNRYASRLLDMSPVNNYGYKNDFKEVTLNKGSPPFADSERGVTIGPVISSSESDIVFELKLPTTSSSPSISYLSPSSGLVGTTVTVNGSNLSSSDTKVKFGFGLISASNVTSNSLTFIVPTYIGVPCPENMRIINRCPLGVALVSPGPYDVSVVTSNGTSNSVNFTVTSAAQPSTITVLSPNGGEQWQVGSTHNVIWDASNLSSDNVSIGLISSDGTRGSFASVPGNSGSYAWTIGDGKWAAWQTPGSYQVFVEYLGPCTQSIIGNCVRLTGTSKVFSIVGTGGALRNLPPVIDGVSGPTQLTVNQTGTWAVKAHDPENGTLSYSVDWGDQPSTDIPWPLSQFAPSYSQTATFSHSYASAGTYTAAFVVSDNQGLVAKTSITVNVSGSFGLLTPTITANGSLSLSQGVYGNISFSVTPTLTVYSLTGSGNVPGMAFVASPHCSQSADVVCPSMSNTIYLDGTPITAGSYPITITAKSQSGGVITKSFTVTVAMGATQPSITSLSPSSGPVGTQATISGTGFTATNNTVKFGNGRLFLSSVDGRTISFVVPETLSACPNSTGLTGPVCTGLFLVSPGQYDISVTNANGTSNSQTFTVIGTGNVTTTPVTCPQYAPPAPDWCSDGTIAPGITDLNGCQGHPQCVRGTGNATSSTSTILNYSPSQTAAVLDVMKSILTGMLQSLR